MRQRDRRVAVKPKSRSRGVSHGSSGTCRRCGDKLSIVLGVRKGRQLEYYSCPACRSRHARAARVQIDVPSAVERVLMLSKLMETAMPWDRELLERQIAHWQKKIDTPQAVTK